MTGSVICSAADHVVQEPRKQTDVLYCSGNWRLIRRNERAETSVRPQQDREGGRLTTASKSPCIGVGRSSWDATC